MARLTSIAAFVEDDRFGHVRRKEIVRARSWMSPWSWSSIKRAVPKAHFHS